jgi:hypothetical protein
MTNANNTRRFGIEIEALGMEPAEVAQLLVDNGIVCRFEGYNHITRDDWKVVTDSSVPDGFEVVSPPLQGVRGLKEARKVVEILNEAGCDVNRKCGVHVHVEVADATPQMLCEVWNRYRRHETTIDAFMPKSRRASNNRFSRSLREESKISPQATPRQTANQCLVRYHKVNLAAYAKYGTVEFRQHSGSLNPAKIANWVRFLLQFVENCKANSSPRGVNLANLPKGVSRRIACILTERGEHGAAAQELADIIGKPLSTIQSAVCRMRRNGWHISTGRRYTLLTVEAQADTPEAALVSNLWEGIEPAIKAYYTRRTALLAA